GKGEAGKGAAVIALAVRAESMDRPALGAAFTNLGGPAGATLLTDANDSLTAYTVRGFPSTVVINAEGRVVGFFEGDVTVAELNAALKGQPIN
ncbi:MAG: TlpA family protein disulfide reductase, partial [bacterium]